jgi:hypothetical protein
MMEVFNTLASMEAHAKPITIHDTDAPTQEEVSDAWANRQVSAQVSGSKAQWYNPSLGRIVSVFTVVDDVDGGETTSGAFRDVAQYSATVSFTVLAFDHFLDTNPDSPQNWTTLFDPTEYLHVRTVTRLRQEGPVANWRGNLRLNNQTGASYQDLACYAQAGAPNWLLFGQTGLTYGTYNLAAGRHSQSFLPIFSTAIFDVHDLELNSANLNRTHVLVEQWATFTSRDIIASHAALMGFSMIAVGPGASTVSRIDTLLNQEDIQQGCYQVVYGMFKK